MAQIRINAKDIKILEIKADLAYNTLRSALDTQDQIQQTALLSSAESLYKYDLENYLNKLTCSATYSFRRLNKGGKRAKKIEPFILQQILMYGYPTKTDSYHMEIIENPDDGMGGLKAFLDAEDDRTTVEGEVFRLTQHKAAELRQDGKYDLILKALNYVREK